MNCRFRTNIFIFLFAIFLLSLVVIKNSVVSEPIIKIAVKEDDLSGAYILCSPVRVTGFDWEIASTTNMGEKNVLCNINGPSPFDLSLKYDFLFAPNTYVFYVDEMREYYSEEIGEQVVEYTVSGWDILYPVHHGTVLGCLKTSKYILQSDISE